jgi:hypothetical protein
MKKLTRFIFSSLSVAGLMAGLGFSSASAAPRAIGLAQQETPPPLTFAMLGRPDTLMRGPFSTTNVRFGLPSNWAFQDGARLELIMTSNLVTDSPNPIAEGEPIGASMTVTLNRKLIATLSVTEGTNVLYEVPIPPDALVPNLSDGRHDLELFLDASTDCDVNNGLHKTTVMVSSASQLVLPYVEQAPVVDLKLLPRPIYQRDSVFPADAVMVVPDQASEPEMRAALITAASFGRLTGGNLPFSLVTTKQVTEELATTSNLIFVGKASTLPQLGSVELPAPLTDGSFSAQGIQEEDGVLQLAVSPWSTGRSIVVVSGNTDVGVVKAAQALSYGSIQTISDPNLAIVTNVVPPAVDAQGINPATLEQSRTFKDLGHDVHTLTGAGRSEFLVEFHVPAGLVAGEGSYLDLRFNNSTLLDFNRSGLTVFLNGQLLGGLRLSDETAATVTQRLHISPSLVLPGTNELRIQANLSPPTQCSLANITDLWVSVLPESTLFLPLQQAVIDSNNLQALSVYPFPFINTPTLSNTAFVLPKNDLAAWSAASQIAYGFGNDVRGSIIDLAVAYDGAVPEEFRNQRDLIVVGLPSDLTFLSEVKDALPAPFEEGKNDPVLDNMPVTYRFSPGTSIGYLELMAAPWNPGRTILAVVGSTSEGLQMAVNALTDSTLRNQLAGNFAMVMADSISAMDTRTGIGLGGIEAQPVVTSQPAVPLPTSPASVPVARPTWVLPLVGVLVILIVGVLIFALISSRRTPVRS